MNYRRWVVLVLGVCVCALLTWSALPASAQDAFGRNDAFDFRGLHQVQFSGPDIDHPVVGIVSTRDWGMFKFNMKVGTKFPGSWYVHGFEVDWTGDGTWDIEIFNSGIYSYTYPAPAPGDTSSYLVRFRIQFRSSLGGQTPPEFRLTGATIRVMPAPRVYTNGAGDGLVQLRNEDCTNKIPLLLVEGIDVTNHTSADVYYALTRPLLDELYARGYEVFFLNFNDADRDLRLNASVVRRALEKVHALCPNAQILLAGMSMGGTVARYALAQAEAEGVAHHVGMFLSYDAPQQKAHANAGLQTWIKEQSANHTAVRALQDKLKTQAAKQMLGFNTYDPSGAEHSTFYNELRALNGDGYPHSSYNVAISNGSLKATWGEDRETDPLLTMKIHEDDGSILLQGFPAGELDVRPGSTQVDLAQAHYGLIYASPWLTFVGVPNDAWFEVAFEFNPVYMPTASTLDLKPAPGFPDVVYDDDGNLALHGGSRFHDYFPQPDPPLFPKGLAHNAVSAASQSKILEWLTRTSTITVNYNLVEGGTTAPETHSALILRGTSVTILPRTVSVNGKAVTYVFSRWDDGNTENPRSLYASHDTTRAAIMKGHRVSNTSAAAWAGNERRITEDFDVVGPTYHAVYESEGSIWHLRNRRNAGWDPERLISSGVGGASDAAIATQSFANADGIQVHVAWREGGAILYRASNVDNGVTWMPEVDVALGLDPATPTFANHRALVWADAEKSGGGIWYYKEPLTNRSRLQHRVPGTAGNASLPAISPASLCGGETQPEGIAIAAQGYDLAFIKDGRVYLAGFSDPNPLDPNTPPQACPGLIDLTTPGFTATNPSLVNTSAGLFVAWEESNGTNRRVAVKQRVGTTWGPSVYLQHVTHVPTKPVLGVDNACGTVNLFWQCDDHIARVTRPLTGNSWATVEYVGPGRAPSIVAQGTFKAMPMWTSGTAAPYSIDFPNSLGCSTGGGGGGGCWPIPCIIQGTLDLDRHPDGEGLRFALAQNQPNPFARTTTIRFEVPTTTKVKLELFDLLGRSMRVLADQEYAAGAHSVEWDRTDRSGSGVKPGVYLYRITAGSFRDQKKMTLLP